MYNYHVPGTLKNMKKHTRKFYRKPSANTMNARKDEYAKKYKKEISELERIVNDFKPGGFTSDMYRILKTGNRPFTEKMHESVLRIINDPRYDVTKMIEMKSKLRPIIKRIDMVYDLVYKVDGHKKPYFIENYSALPFVESIKNQVETRYRITEKQMLGLAKVYKKYKIKHDKVENKDKSKK